MLTKLRSAHSLSSIKTELIIREAPGAICWWVKIRRALHFETHVKLDTWYVVDTSVACSWREVWSYFQLKVNGKTIDNYRYFSSIQGINNELYTSLRVHRGRGGGNQNYLCCDGLQEYRYMLTCKLTVQALVLVIVTGFSLPRNSSSNVSLLTPLRGVEWNPPVGTVSTGSPNGLSKYRNVVSQESGGSLRQFSFRCTLLQQVGCPPLPHSPHCSPRGLRNS